MKPLEEVGSVALVGSVAWNSCAQEVWALQVVWVWGADLLACRVLGTVNLEPGAWAALW